MVEARAGARRPGGAERAQIDVGGGFAEELEAVAAIEQALPDGDQRLELDGFDLGAVLFALQPLLGLFVVVELALDPQDRAVEGVDGRPEDLVEVEVEAGVGHGGDQGVEDVGDRGADDLILGRDPGVGLVLGGTIAVEFEGFDDMAGGRGAVIGVEIVMGVHERRPWAGPRPSRPSWRRKPTGGPVRQPEPFARALMAKPG